MSLKKTRICDLSAYFGPQEDNCQVPPPGWWCSREPGHDGPCAAREYRDDPRLEQTSIHSRQEES